LKYLWIVLVCLSWPLITTGEEGKEQSDLININETTAEELVVLPGIGPARAKAIVDFREAHGDFEKITDLLRIRGIGEKTLANIADLITVGDAKKNETPPMAIRRVGKLAIVWAKLKAGRQRY